MDKIFNCQNELIDEENGARILCNAVFIIKDIEDNQMYYCPKCRFPIDVKLEGEFNDSFNYKMLIK